MDAQPALSTDNAPDDAAVIAHVLDGETQQYAHLVRRYQAALYRYAVSTVLDHAAAADMVQDAFVRAYTQLRACRDRTRFGAWLIGILRHRCLDYLKDPRRRTVGLEEADVFEHAAEGPGARVERAQVRRDIRWALAHLSAAQREAFLMHYVEEVPYETMAERLGASVSALKMRVLRAREVLATALQAHHVTPASGRSSFIQTPVKRQGWR